MDKSNWIVLLTGAVGALTAIFLKEVVQTALKRQILIGQLYAYVLIAKRQVTRQPLAYSLFTLVEEREKKVTDALREGKTAGLSQIIENNKLRDEARDRIKAEIEKAATSEEGLRKSETTASIFSAGIEAFVVGRQYLMEGKTFLNDGDAAHLGPAIAFSVVQFRASAAQIYLGFEGLIRAAHSMNEGESNKVLLKLISNVVDSMIVDGEQYLVSLINLERNVERKRKRNLLQHCWDILCGN